MMTEEELWKAQKEGTWLIAYDKWLIRADRLHMLRKCKPEKDSRYVGRLDLRIATPNDMLKYGE